MEQGPEPGKRRWSVYRTPRGGVSGEASETPTSSPPPDRPTQPVRVSATPSLRQTSGISRGVLVVVGVVVFGIIGLVSVVIASVASDGGPFGDSEVQVLTEDGMSDFIDAVEEKTGRTEAFSATIYPTYAVVRVPVDDSSQRYIGYYWDGGDLEEWAGKGTSTDERFDLLDVETSVVLPLVKRAKSRIEDPNTWYVIVDHSNTDTEVGW